MLIADKLRPEIVSFSKELGVNPSLLQAIIKAECKFSNGFLYSYDEKGREVKEPVILYECHVAYRLYAKKFGEARAREVANRYPDILNPNPYGSKSNPRKYGKYTEQHARLQRAVALVGRDIALQSCSWGVGQIMGENWDELGYKSLQEFVTAMYDGEVKQLEAMIKFIRTKKGLLDAIKRLDFQKIAYLYNGEGYAKNQYDVKIKQYFNEYRGIYG